jgi:hypothetical protein
MPDKPEKWRPTLSPPRRHHEILPPRMTKAGQHHNSNFKQLRPLPRNAI